MKAFVAITDFQWYSFLASLSPIDEINFWQPGSNSFRVLATGEPFLFKLHSPRNFIVGGGFFVHWTRLPVALAWETFGIKNGVNSLRELQMKIEHYRKGPVEVEEHQIGCIILAQPFFLKESEWIHAPADWSQNIVSGKSYSLREGPGKAIWDHVQQRLSSGAMPAFPEKEQPRFGKPVKILPRLGQGAFRILVTDAYNRRCAVTGERVLPALEAAHIRSYSDNGPHAVDNGLLLRSDLHRLFDRGYITVDEHMQLDISRKIRERFHNGHEYYALRGRQIDLPRSAQDKPNQDYLRWHNEHCFLG